MATAFAHCAVQAPPAFLQNDFSDSNVDTGRMVTFATLCTGN